MTCADCGQPCEGRRCQMCQRADRAAEEYAAETDGGAVAVAEESDDSPEVPPPPEEVIDDARYQYQAMTQLDDDEYARLAADIRESGVLQPVIVDDSPEQVIIDGHHREAIAQYYDLPKEKQPAYVVVGGAGNDEKLSRAIKQNLIGRDTTEGVKSHAVRQYIELSWDRTDDGDLIRPETDSDVAEKLGVSQQLVSKVVNGTNGGIIDHDRVKARRYYEDNRDASYREVARQVDSAKATVTRWLKEDFDESEDDEDEDDEQPTLTATTTDRNEAEKTADVFTRSEDVEKEADRGDGEDKIVEDADSEETESGGAVELPDIEYDVVYADPPWRYNFSKTSNREVENQYETMSLADIKALEVPAGDDAVLYLWATAPKLPEAVSVLREWGFEYTTNLVWDKERMGMGYWSRVQHEHLLIGTRGDVSPPSTGDRRRSVIREQRGEHSSKPDTVADMIAAQHDGADLIELFARDTRDGWDSWGKEAPAEVADD